MTDFTLGGTVTNNDGVDCALMTAAGGRASTEVTITIEAMAMAAIVAILEVMSLGLLNIARMGVCGYQLYIK